MIPIIVGFAVVGMGEHLLFASRSKQCDLEHKPLRLCFLVCEMGMVKKMDLAGRQCIQRPAGGFAEVIRC